MTVRNLKLTDKEDWKTSDKKGNREYQHPESQRTYALKDVIALNVWHGNHHSAHIR